MPFPSPWDEYDGTTCGVEVEESTDIYTQNEEDRRSDDDDD